MKSDQRCGAAVASLSALALTLSLASSAATVSAQPAQQARHAFNVPAGLASRVVAEFARQAGVNVLAPADQLGSATLNQVKGQYTLEEALQRLLNGTGLISRHSPGGAIIIEAAPSPPVVAAPAVATTARPLPEAPPVVMVTGFRTSVDTAQERKRSASGIVDVILPEDVSKFPDANLAESLQRVAGVALVRGDGGEGRQITVRGLSPSFTRVRINGIEAAAASGASDINGSTNRSRSFDFSVFAAELFNDMQVHKTSSADVEEGSLGATVDLRSARPLDFKRNTFSLSAQAVHNSVSRKTQPRLAGQASGRWHTPFGKLGAVVSAAYAQRRASEEGYEAVELLAASADGGFCSPLGLNPPTPRPDAVKGIDASRCGHGVARLADPSGYLKVMGQTDDYGATVAQPAPGSGAFHPRLPRYRRSQTDYVRTGVTAALQWRPARDTEVGYDAMLGKFDNRRTDQYIAAISFARTLGAANGKPQTSIVDAHFDHHGSWDYGRFNAVDLRSEGLLDLYTTTFRQNVLSATHKLGERGMLKFAHGVSTTVLDNPVRTTVSFDAPNVNGFAFDFRGRRNLPLLDFSLDVRNPANFSFAPQEPDGTYHGQIVDRYLHTSNRLRTTSLEGSWDLGDGLVLKTGLSRRHNTWNNFEIGSNGAGLSLPPGVNVGSISRQVEGFGRGLGSGVPSSWVTVDLDKLLAVANLHCHCDAVPGSQWQTFGMADRKVDERIDAWYGQLDFRQTVLGIGVRGNLGLRTAPTRLASAASNDVNGAMVPVLSARRYRDWLPSLNLVAELPNNVDLRLSAARTLARPEYVDLTPSAILMQNLQQVTLGNPGLNPVRARAFDLQAEWYYTKGGLVSVGYFHKRTTSFIQSVSERKPWRQLGLPDSLLTVGGCSISGSVPACATLPDTTVVVNRKLNTPGGSLNGLEFNLQAPFSFLPGPWRHTGLIANATLVQSRITYLTRSDNPATPANETLTQVADFTGLSPRTHHLTLYYEDRRVGARISFAHRSAYLTDVLGNVAGHDYTFADGSTQVGVSLAYQLTPRLRLRLEGQNLNDPFLRYGRDLQRNDTLLYVHSGRTIAVGLSYTH